MSNLDGIYGAIEAGGTKFVCAVAREPDCILAKQSFATETPEQTMANVLNFFEECQQQFGSLKATGLGSFGPVNIDIASSAYGRIGSTPKVEWSDFDIVGSIENATHSPVVLDTDVHCALLGEAVYGAGKGFKDLIYLTVGTGIGGGAMINGNIVYGNSHPEFGHMLLSKHPLDINFNGSCPFHGDRCAEGLAAGPSLEKRWNCSPKNLAKDHIGWEIEAYYLASLCMNLQLSFAPERIILGGGVMQQSHLFKLIYKALEDIAAGYIDFGFVDGKLDRLIVPAFLNGEAGVYGAIQLARNFSQK